jgi:hypothetical protein
MRFGYECCRKSWQLKPLISNKLTSSSVETFLFEKKEKENPKQKGGVYASLKLF